VESYPQLAVLRDRFVFERRAERPVHDATRYQALIVEDEPVAHGPFPPLARVATIFLTGRECPWRCAMCDLWRYTIDRDTPLEAIPAQLADAFHELDGLGERVDRMKLYNAGSLFDPRAVPVADYDRIGAQLGGLSGVVVESHPSLIGVRVDRFLEALGRSGARTNPPRLEVAMGLETAHPEALERLNKRMTVEGFATAAEALRRRGVDVRAFVLISPPFVPLVEQDVWLLRSVETALSCGAAVVSLVPTRPGNGTLEALAAEGYFQAPQLADIERSTEMALASCSNRGRIFVDVWDLERFAVCVACRAARRARLHAMNLQQRVLPRVPCTRCGATTES
jgi:archaeosine synthase beta-subunit